MEHSLMLNEVMDSGYRVVNVVLVEIERCVSWHLHVD